MRIKITDQAGMIYDYGDVTDHGVFGEIYALLIDGKEILHDYNKIVSVERF